MAFTTRKSLLGKVRNGDEVSWKEFYTAYKPLILLCGRDCHLTEDENEELVQRVMCEVFQRDIIGKYDPEKVPDSVTFHYNPVKGHFRHYLKRIIRNHAAKIFNERKGRSAMRREGRFQSISGESEWENAWNEEWQKHLMNRALQELKSRIQPETYVAFEMYALQNRTVQEVADFLNLSVSSVYTSKSRCIAALKKIIQSLEEK